MIGEAIVTMRAGRYVIPIRAEAKGKLKGIVHDQSASGATLFVEPLTVVELNNTWTQASLDAAREEERILDELSREVEARAEPLLASLAALARADLWIARARLGDGRSTGSARSSPMTPPSCSPRAIRCSGRARCRSTCASVSASAIGR